MSSSSELLIGILITLVTFLGAGVAFYVRTQISELKADFKKHVEYSFQGRREIDEKMGEAKDSLVRTREEFTSRINKLGGVVSEGFTRLKAEIDATNKEIERRGN